MAPAAPALSRSGSSNSNTGPSFAVARNRFTLLAGSEPKSRGTNDCGRDCHRLFDAARSLRSYEDWSHQDQHDFDLVRGGLRPGTPTCTVAAFLPGRACFEVHAALAKRPCKAIERLPDTVVEEGAAKRQIEPYFEEKDASTFSAEEIRNRAPRTVQPWQPCYHPGRACSSFTGTEDAGQDELFPICTCKRNGTWCEPGCGCELDCNERFKGCNCAARGRACKGKSDTSNGRTAGCPCVEAMRECHRELCAGHRDKVCAAMRFQSDNAVVSRIVLLCLL